MGRTPPEVSRSRERALLRQYGLTLEDFKLMWKYQAGRCAMCRRPFTAIRPWHVDHCHRTGEVRGLLCVRDNYELLGHWGDDPAFYERVAYYLLDAPADHLPGEVPTSPNAPPQE